LQALSELILDLGPIRSFSLDVKTVSRKSGEPETMLPWEHPAVPRTFPSWLCARSSSVPSWKSERNHHHWLACLESRIGLTTDWHFPLS